jgi:hypothetical protein
MADAALYCEVWQFSGFQLLTGQTANPAIHGPDATEHERVWDSFVRNFPNLSDAGQGSRKKNLSSSLKCGRDLFAKRWNKLKVKIGLTNTIDTFLFERSCDVPHTLELVGEEEAKGGLEFYKHYIPELATQLLGPDAFDLRFASKLWPQAENFIIVLLYETWRRQFKQAKEVRRKFAEKELAMQQAWERELYCFVLFCFV